MNMNNSIEVSVIPTLRVQEFNYQEYFELDGVFWYDYEFLCKLLGLYKIDLINRIYIKKINIKDKNIFETHRRGCDYTIRKRFITTDAVVELINRNTKDGNHILATILNNEANTKGTLFSEFAHDLNNLGDNPINDMFIIHEIHESGYFNEMREKYDPSYNANVEKAVDDYREILRELDGEDFEELDVKLSTKRDGCTDKEREIKYKRMKESGKKFEAPSWLREIIK